MKYNNNNQYSCKPFQQNTEIPPNLCLLKKNQQYAILSIIQNSDFITKMAGSTKLARAYYNSNKEWCLTLDLKSITNFNNKTILLRAYQTIPKHLEITNSFKKCKEVNINKLFTYGPQTKEEAIFFFIINIETFLLKFYHQLDGRLQQELHINIIVKK